MSRERILILCRAIPEESKTFFNTVCVAGITEKGEWRRLYPVPFKPFVKGAGIPFRKKDWIEVDTHKTKPTDKRIESRRIDHTSINVIRRATDEQIREFVTPFISPSIKTIEESGASLGLIKPKIFEYDCKVIDTEEWDKNQVDLHGNPKGKIKLGQVSTYKFVCEKHNVCSCRKKPHAIEVRDWEINELYRKIIRKTKNPNLIRIKMKEKWFDWMRQSKKNNGSSPY